jgi:hypothetical protein
VLDGSVQGLEDRVTLGARNGVSAPASMLDGSAGRAGHAFGLCS